MSEERPSEWPRVRWYMSRKCTVCKNYFNDPMCRMCAFHSVEWLEYDAIGEDEDSSDEDDIDCCECSGRSKKPAICDDCARKK